MQHEVYVYARWENREASVANQPIRKPMIIQIP